MGFCEPSRVTWCIAVALRLAAAIVIPSASVGAFAHDEVTTRKDVQVAVRALAFLAPPPTGPVPVAVVYAPDNPTSTADAGAVMGWLEGESRTGAIEMRPTLLRANDLGRLVNYRVAFVTHGLETYYERIGNAASQGGVLTISTDPECARNAHCAMSVVSEPKVEITISNAAASAARVQFSTAFRILVNEQ